eukprot:1145176-Pelagomonas_calceolata.AAC.10
MPLHPVPPTPETGARWAAVVHGLQQKAAAGASHKDSAGARQMCLPSPWLCLYLPAAQSGRGGCG